MTSLVGLLVDGWPIVNEAFRNVIQRRTVQLSQQPLTAGGGVAYLLVTPVTEGTNVNEALTPLEYPGHAEIRRVDQNGYAAWRQPLFVSAALAGEDVAFEEVDDGIWTVTFATVTLGRFDERQHRIHPMAPVSAGRSASCAGSAPDRKNKER